MATKYLNRAEPCQFAAWSWFFWLETTFSTKVYEQQHKTRILQRSILHLYIAPSLDEITNVWMNIVNVHAWKDNYNVRICSGNYQCCRNRHFNYFANILWTMKYRSRCVLEGMSRITTKGFILVAITGAEKT